MIKEYRYLKIDFSPDIYFCTFTGFILSLALLSSEAFASGDSPDDFCRNYDWEKVEELVEPYLDDASFTSLVMQGVSSEYNTSVAAHQAMHSQLPEEIYNILSRIVKFNCL